MPVAAPATAPEVNRSGSAHTCQLPLCVADADADTNDRVLGDALRHFAAHGLGAVDAALGEARRAAEAGDEPERRRWLAICAMFDRRAALIAADEVLTEPAY